MSRVSWELPVDGTGGGRPLEDGVRAFFEARFRRGFAHVRVHDGPAAQAMARALGARAFAAGAEIFVGEGGCDPGSPDGLRLLAHELAHVVQQEHAEPGGAACPVGAADDPAEREADAVARLAPGREPIVVGCRDRRRVIRRAVSVSPATASITTSITGAVPEAAILPKRVVCHLTKGFNPDEQFDPTKPNKSQVAWTAAGKIKILKGPTDSLDLWEFGFIQFQKVNSYSFFFAGKTSSAGSISIIAHEPPAMADKTALDSVLAFSPWTKKAPRFTLTGNDVDCATGDHPMVSAGLSVKNRTTNEDNFLFHIVNDREFFTVLSAQDPNGVTTHLRNFHWSLRYDFKFNWRNGRPVKASNGSAIKFGNVESGAPTAPELAALLPVPVGPFANEIGAVAVVTAVQGFHPVNRKDLAKRFANVPVDFFQ